MNLTLFPSVIDCLSIKFVLYVTCALGLHYILHGLIELCDGNKNILFM